MAGLKGCMSILNILIVLTLGAVGLTEDRTEDNSLSEGAPPPFALPTTEWSTAFEQADASPLVKGKLLRTIPALGKQWRVSLEVFPENFNRKGPTSSLGSIIHLVTEERLGKFGTCIPAIWIHRSKGVLVSTALGKQPIFKKLFRSNIPTPGNWTQIEVSQSLEGEDYIYAVHIGGKRLFSLANPRPIKFYDVKVFAGSLSSPPLDGSIRNLKIEVGVEKPSSIEEGIYFSLFGL